MTDLTQNIGVLRDKVLAAPRRGKRRVVALAGPPASGKSTLAKSLADSLCAAGCMTQVVPMDGFHLDNNVLIERGLLHRKGAPETFDAPAFVQLVAKLADVKNVSFPEFDRAADVSIPDAAHISPNIDTIIVEGNYLLMDLPIWRDLAPFWDLSMALKTDAKILHARLLQRWIDHGLDEKSAQKRAEENDLINAKLVAQLTKTAEVWITND